MPRSWMNNTQREEVIRVCLHFAFRRARARIYIWIRPCDKEKIVFFARVHRTNDITTICTRERNDILRYIRRIGSIACGRFFSTSARMQLVPLQLARQETNDCNRVYRSSISGIKYFICASKFILLILFALRHQNQRNELIRRLLV